MGANSFVCETIDGVAVLCWNDSTSMMNLLDFGVIMELRAHIDRIFRDDSVEGIVLTSGKKDFSGGMDLRLFSTFASNKEKESTENEGETELMLSNSQRAYTFIMQIHELLLLIEKSKKPFVSASPGTAIGGGYEIMLATHRRFLADNPKARIGLPEVLVGLFPGAGGTTRLIRMLGIARAAPYLLEGKLLNPEKAMRAGLVDEIVAPDKLVARAIAWVKQAKPADILKPWFKSDYKIPGGGVYSAAGASVFVSWIAMANQHSWGNYPNINGMLSAIYEGSLVSFETALRIETRWFVNVLLKPQSQAMIKTMFVNKQSLEKGGARPKEIPTNPVKKLGIVGAGFMGSEIAYSSACAGINVVLLDKDEESLNEDKKKIQTLVDEYAKRGISQDVIDGINSRLHFSMDTDEFKLCDLVIESVYEDLALKNEILNGIDAVVAPECIIATNTSTFLLKDLSKDVLHKDRFIGIHFFSPVHKMLLVELIQGEHTSCQTIAKAFDFVMQLKKVPILVRDAFAFYANRCVLAYMSEALRMIAEGVSPIEIENAAKSQGMSVGPLQLADELSLDLCLSIIQRYFANMPSNSYENDIQAIKVIYTLVETLSRKGKNNGAGFYEYSDNGKRVRLWPGLIEHYLHESLSEKTKIELPQRLIVIQVIEALKLLESGILRSMYEGNVAAILGWGFPSISGGPFSYVDLIGLRVFSEKCRYLESQYGERFRAPKILDEFIEGKRSF